MPHVFQTEQWVLAPLERVFRFFSDPRNLEIISPPSAGAILRSVQTVPPQAEGVSGPENLAGAGSEIVLSVRLLPYFPLRRLWTARIVEYEWLHYFRDVQLSGPFKQFDHTHYFVSEQRNALNGTLIRDHVEYEIGFGSPGRIANALLVRPILRQLFTYRHALAARLLQIESD